MKTVLVTGACINTGVAIVEKFASEGYNVVFTGRNQEQVKETEARYRQRFPAVSIVGYTLNSLTDERTVNEAAVDALFDDLDQKGIFIETLGNPNSDIPDIDALDKKSLHKLFAYT
jgi:NAD(P)-dependent dehydrogenase (short-subunit alcohol dehydrogenase family)